MTHMTGGRIHGKTIEIDVDLGVPNGHHVEVIVRVTESLERWSEGICRSAGAAADVADFEEVFAQIESERKASRVRDADAGARKPS
ncbi:MAG TPA: hypothetical protein VFI31_29150 [Pirellulales bacterium]|nr:hypothetical protein [Pirellulales bacterium]